MRLSVRTRLLQNHFSRGIRWSTRADSCRPSPPRRVAGGSRSRPSTASTSRGGRRDRRLPRPQRRRQDDHPPDADHPAAAQEPAKPRSPATTSPRAPTGARASAMSRRRQRHLSASPRGGSRARQALRDQPREGDRARAAALEQLDLTGRGTHAEAMTGGQRRRLDIAIGSSTSRRSSSWTSPPPASIPRPRDPLGPHRALRSERAATVFLTTHYLDEADALCDRVMIIDQGRIMASDTSGGLRAVDVR